MCYYLQMAGKNVLGNSMKRKLADAVKRPPKKPCGHWSMGLKSSMEDPDLLVEKTETLTVIKDKYPKAKFHFLIMPNENISSLKKLSAVHLPLLKEMHEKGQAIAESSSKVLKFRLGYHAVPSMSHIHLHVISQDFNSPCLKHKKHWNSFTSEYFVDSKEVMKILEETGKVDLDTSKYEAMLKQDLKCHVCDERPKNIPTLKAHILKHIPKEER